MSATIVLGGETETLALPDTAGTAQPRSFDVRGTAEAETVQVLPGGEVTNFSAGDGDRLAFAGASDAYTYSLSGNTLTVENDTTQASIALNGEAELAFADGTLSAGLSAGSDGIALNLGGKSFSSNEAIDPAADGVTLGDGRSSFDAEGTIRDGDPPTPKAPQSDSLLLLDGSGGPVPVARPVGVSDRTALDVRGTSAAETVQVLPGTQVASFSAGTGDAVQFAGRLDTYRFTLNGNVLTVSDTQSAAVADIALNATTTLSFRDGSVDAGLSAGNDGIQLELGGRTFQDNEEIQPFRFDLAVDPQNTSPLERADTAPGNSLEPKLTAEDTVAVGENLGFEVALEEFVSGGPQTVEVMLTSSAGNANTARVTIPEGERTASGELQIDPALFADVSEGDEATLEVRQLGGFEPEPVAFEVPTDNTVSLGEMTVVEGQTLEGTIELDAAPEQFVTVNWRASGPDGYVQEGEETFVAGRDTTSKTFEAPGPEPDGESPGGPDVTLEITGVETEANVAIENGSITKEAGNADPSGLIRGDTVGVGGTEEIDTAFRFRGGNPVLSEARDKIATAVDVALSWWDDVIDVAGETEIVFELDAAELDAPTAAVTFPRATRTDESVPGISGETQVTELAHELDTPDTQIDDDVDSFIRIDTGNIEAAQDDSMTDILSGEALIVGTMAHEIGHTLGIAKTDESAFAEHIEPDPDTPNMDLFTGPTVEAVNGGPLSVFETEPSHLNNSLNNLPENESPIMTAFEKNKAQPIDAAIARDVGLKLHDDALDLDFIG